MTEGKRLQNATLSKKDIMDIERIKPMILQRKTELEISEELGLHRVTISRKIARWARTPDFANWIAEAWLDKLKKVPDSLAFRGLTLLMRLKLKYDLENQPRESPEPLVFRWMTEEEWNEKLQSSTVPIVGKENFMKAQQDSGSSCAEGDGAKPVVEQTNS